MPDDTDLSATQDIDALLMQAESDATTATALLDAGEEDANETATGDDAALLTNDDIETLLSQAEERSAKPTRISDPENGEYLSPDDVNTLAGPKPKAQADACDVESEAPKRSSPRDILKRPPALRDRDTDTAETAPDRPSQPAYDSGNEGIDFDENEIHDSRAPSLGDDEQGSHSDVYDRQRFPASAESQDTDSVRTIRVLVSERLKDAAARLIIKLGSPLADLGPAGRAITTCLTLATLVVAIFIWVAGFVMH